MLGLSAVVAVLDPGAHRAGDLAAAARRGRHLVQLHQHAPTDGRASTCFAASAITSGRRRRSAVTLVASLVLTGILTVGGEPRRARSADLRARGVGPRPAAAPGPARRHRPGDPHRARARGGRASRPGILLAVAGGAGRRGRARCWCRRPRRPGRRVVYLYTAFALAPPAIVLERQPVVAALRRSRAAGPRRVVADLRHPAARQHHRPGASRASSRCRSSLLTLLVAWLGGDDLNVYALAAR